MTDLQGREINYLRASITNQCNLSCKFCSPCSALSQSVLMTPQQLEQICKAAVACGIKNIRLTGGEPLTRPDFIEIVQLISNIQNVNNISLTTNGILLNEEILALPIANINISINATEEKLYNKLCGGIKLQTVLTNAKKAAQGHKVKINCVLLKDSFRQQVEQVISFCEDIGASPRFIELMPMGNGAQLKGVKEQELIAFLTKKYGEARPCAAIGNGPAKYFTFAGLKQAVGFISPMSDCFCSQCSRIRLLANGSLQPCLAKPYTIDLLWALKNGNINKEFANVIMQKQGSHDLHHITLKALKEIGG